MDLSGQGLDRLVSDRKNSGAPDHWYLAGPVLATSKELLLVPAVAYHFLFETRHGKWRKGDNVMKHAPLATARLLLALATALLGVFRHLFASAGDEDRPDERRIHDSDISGQLNHRTGRLDSGLDPYGWYDED
jgi:hypothetical protein